MSQALFRSFPSMVQFRFRDAETTNPCRLREYLTGIGPRDVTPEATLAILEREIPGLGEAMRAVSRGRVPTADLSRAVGGTRGRALVVNLPGSPAGARECLAAVLPALLHGVKLLAGSLADCRDDPGVRG
jgi:hypothetical protein